MPRDLALSLNKVTKAYYLYANPVDQAIDLLGLRRVFFWRKGASARQFMALRDISLEVRRGERVAIIGRNGAGKTTLLKLIIGNHQPTSGQVSVNGAVQALMTMGLGFHPEFSGYDNIRSSLMYNGLGNLDLRAAIEDVIDFSELREFLHQPLKTYSTGMQARLMFATATALKPDILVIDEVLGAGDAYFAAKSAHRMQHLTKSGCTLLLVSHSMQQVLQFCERAVWLESGSAVLDGTSLEVVKAYEEFSQKLEHAYEGGEQAVRGERTMPNGLERMSILENAWLREKILSEVLSRSSEDRELSVSTEEEQLLAATAEVQWLSTGGVSRWGGGVPGLKIRAVRLHDPAGKPVHIARAGSPLVIELEVVAEEAGDYPCIAVILLFGADGRWLTRHCSKEFRLELAKGEAQSIELRYDCLLLGNGMYCFSAAIYERLDLNDLGSARFYDLLSRSFQFEVVGPYRTDQSIFYHPAEWSVGTVEPQR